MMDRSADLNTSDGDYGYHHCKIDRVCTLPKVRNVCIIYPLKFAIMYMVNQKDYLIDF